MGLYINDKEKFLALCEEFYDSGRDYILLGYDKDGNLRIDTSTNATEQSLGCLLYGAGYCKFFGCGLDYYEKIKDNKL